MDTQQPEVDQLEPITNQTQFAIEETAKEHPPTMEVGSSSSQPKKPESAQSKKLKVLVGLLVVMVVLTVVFAVVFSPRKKVIQVLQPTPTPVAQTAQESAIYNRIQEVKKDLSAADPVKNDFVFPPVDMTLQLEKTR